MRKRTRETACGADVLQAIRNAYPENLVTDDILYEENSYYDGIRAEVRAALCGIKAAELLYDHPPEGRPHWDEGADPDEDPPAWVEEASSYDSLFLALRGEAFQFEGEMEEEDVLEDAEEPVPVLVPTVGRIGCAVGISLVAPFAVVRFTEMELAESGSTTLPDIWPHIFDLDGNELDMEAHYEELFLEEGIAALRGLRTEITRILSAFDIRVLSEQELEVPVPGLKPEPERSVILEKETASVAEALFFQTI